MTNTERYMLRRLSEIDESRTDEPRDIGDYFPDSFCEVIERLKKLRWCEVRLLVTGPGKGVSAYVLSDSEHRGEEKTCAVVPNQQARYDLMVYRAQFSSATSIVDKIDDVPEGTSHVYVHLPIRGEHINGRWLRCLEGTLPPGMQTLVFVLTTTPHWTLFVPRVFDTAYAITSVYRSDRDREMRYGMSVMGGPEQTKIIPFPENWRKRETSSD